ncbi:MAG: hypothetical protein AAGB93_17850 [Planctomycetota bacterium]
MKDPSSADAAGVHPPPTMTTPDPGPASERPTGTPGVEAELPGAELAAVEAAAEGRTAALGALFNLPALLGLSTSALARELGVDRSTLQRLVQAVRSATGAAEILAILPGSRGMRRCLETWTEWSPDDAARQACRRALEAAEELDRAIRRAGGTRPKVLELLRGGGRTPPSEPGGDLRERFFDDATELLGSSCAVAVKVFAYALAAGEADRMERATLEAMYGYTAREHAAPVLLSLNTYYQSKSAAPEVDFAPKGWIAEHSSVPPMVVSARTNRTRDALVLAEPGDAPSRDRDLCVMADRHDYSLHPSRLESPLQEAMGLVHYPARRLLQLVLLQRALHRDSTSQWSEAKLWRPNLGALHGDRFLVCLPDPPSLRIVDRVPDGLAVEGFPRLSALAATVLERSGWAPEDFVGLLIDVPFPVWRAGYSIGVEFD